MKKTLPANHYYRLLLLDIDGTVARDYYSISPRVLEKVREVNKKINVVLISGRSAKSVAEIAQSLQLDRPQIVEGGSKIIMPDGKIVWQRYLLKATVEKIVLLLHRHDIPYNMCVDGISQIIHAVQDLDRLDLERVSRISLLQLRQIHIQKHLRVLRDIKNLNFVQVKNTLHRGFWNIDITEKRANKKNAVLRLKKLLTIHKDEIVGVGDDYNDISFIGETGFKVAMGNAVDELKIISDYIAPSVSNDGLINIITLIQDVCRR